MEAHMTWTTFGQITIDMILLSGLTLLWSRLRRPPQDDPRLSRGLQLLQSKITVLEDLSDRTDAQVKQLTMILDQKTRYIQDKIVQAEQQVLRVEHSMQKSLEVAEIFQDRIPHEEVLERKRTIEYVKAARLSHQGRNIDEIAAQVDLPREQVELIAKFNREQLMFDEEALPSWAKSAGLEAPQGPSLNQMDFLNSLETSKQDLSGLNNIGEKFKESVRDYEAKEAAAQPTPTPQAPAVAPRPEMKFTLNREEAPAPESRFQPLKAEASATTKAILGAAQSITQSLANTAANLLSIQDIPNEPQKPGQPVIRKVEFPRIQMPPKNPHI
jgi:hypothetical protein